MTYAISTHVHAKLEEDEQDGEEDEEHKCSSIVYISLISNNTLALVQSVETLSLRLHL